MSHFIQFLGKVVCIVNMQNLTESSELWQYGFEKRRFTFEELHAERSNLCYFWISLLQLSFFLFGFTSLCIFSQSAVWLDVWTCFWCKQQPKLQLRFIFVHLMTVVSSPETNFYLFLILKTKKEIRVQPVFNIHISIKYKLKERDVKITKNQNIFKFNKACL